MSKGQILKILFVIIIVPILITNISAVSLTSVKIHQYKQNENMLKIYFAADDEGGNRILNLTDKNVDLFVENDKLEITQISPFTTTDEKVTYILLIDISGSIAKSQFTAVCEAIAVWIDKMDPDDKMAIVTFGERINVVSTFTSDKEKLKQLVTGLKNSDSATQLYGGIVRTAEMLRISDSNLPDRRSVIVFTDGQNGTSSTYTRDEAVNAIAESNIPFYAVGFSPSSKTAGEAFADFGSVMRQSGGDLYEIKSETNILNVFDEIYAQISDIYLINAKIPKKICNGEKRVLHLSVSIESIIIEKSIDAKFMPLKNQDALSQTTDETTTEATNTEENGFGTNLVLYAAIFAIPVTGIIFFLIFFFVKRRNKVQAPTDNPQPNPPYTPIGLGPTAPIGSFDPPPDGGGGGTKPLFPEIVLDISEVNKEKGTPPKEYIKTMITGTSIKIGRDPSKSNMIIDNDDTVSGEQCIIKAEPDGLSIINKSKTNVTILNDQPVGNIDYELMPSLSTIKIGYTELTISVRK